MKRIEDIDPNFRLDASVPAEYIFRSPLEEPFGIYGLAPDEGGVYCRLPVDFLPECNEGVQTLAWHLAGACVRFSTDSDGIAVVWKLKEKGNMAHFTACGQSGLQLFEESDAGIHQVKNLIPAMDDGCGCRLAQSAYVPLKGGMRSYALYLPLYNGLDELLIGLAPDAGLEKGRRPRIEKPVLFYGSSITQGGCASKVGNCYTNILCRRLDAAQRNLGFSGSGKGEENMAHYIASQEMSVFVMDYDHNAPDAAHLERTHERFFRIVRKAQPELPVVILTMPDFDRDPVNNTKRRDIIRRTYENALAAGDRNVYFIDGESFFGREDRELCTVDDCHPNDIGFLRMADVLTPVLRGILYADG